MNTLNVLSVLGMAAAAGAVSGVAGVAGVAAAAGPGVAEAGGPVRIAGHIYINAATGEMTRTPQTPRLGDPEWENVDTGACGPLYLALDDPGRDEASTGRRRFGSAVAHWGDIGRAARFSGFDFGYATDIGDDPAARGIEGLRAIITFFSEYDGGLNPGGTQGRVLVRVAFDDIAGGDDGPGALSWVYTVDLEGTALETSFPETDLDGDGRHDFGYAYEFEQRQDEAKGEIGPLLVRPLSLGGQGTAYGCPDAMDWFNQPGGPSSFDGYFGPIWFGGGDCGASPPRPYASMWMTVYGGQGPICSPCCDVDYIADGLLDFTDYLEFLNRYDARDLSADLSGDGLVDFGDYLVFLSIWDQCQ